MAGIMDQITMNTDQPFIDNPETLSTVQLLNFADRSDPVVRVLCERLETYVKGYASQRIELESTREFKKAFYKLSEMVDKL